MKEKLTFGRAVFSFLNYGFFAIFTFMCLYPLWYVIIYAISDPAMVAGRVVTIYPLGFSTYNIQRVLQLDGLLHALFISVARTVIGTGLSVIS